jgi:hypothetical protein
LQRGTDWENYPIRPFFKFSESDFDLLENGGIKTVGDLSLLVQRKKEVPKFGKRKLELLERQFEQFWTNHPELCNGS